MDVLLATANPGKLAELRALLPAHVGVLGLTDAGLHAPDETGTTFVENALLKARAALVAAPIVIADDSGLEVDALQGRPGVYSSRYAGEPPDDARNNARLLRELVGVPPARRTARFRSTVALVTRDGREVVAEGVVEGRIVAVPRGTSGFGYDPLFEITDPQATAYRGRTLAELDLEDKNRVSHRARAYQALLAQLRERDDDLRTLIG
jgi:XTP/dITP diphosphohydrolase